MIIRTGYLEKVRSALRRNPITAILGPRQCGKTTLARQVAEGWADRVHMFDLESPADEEALSRGLVTLEPLNGLVIVDEIQRRPELFALLRILADRPETPARFLILGSASPDMVRGASESLAGRVEFVDLTGFCVVEVGVAAWRTLWNRGGFPRSYLADGDADSRIWREQFVRTFLERDVPGLGHAIPAGVLRRFWSMVAHYHGQTWNGAEIAASMGLSDHTVRRYLDLLTGAYMVRQLPPWHENLGKRQRKSPKVYLRDSGILHALLGGITDADDLARHPKCGASWEGFAMEQILSARGDRDAYYWAVHSGPELDLLLAGGNCRIGFEFKFNNAPEVTRSMVESRRLLNLDHLFAVYPGSRRFTIAPGIEAVPLAEIGAALGEIDRGRRS